MHALRLYTQRPVLSVFLLGISSGLPWAMIGTALTLWLKEAGFSRSAIGFSGLIFSVYAVNFLWAPLLDRFAPRLRGRLGARRSWVLLCQIGVALCCLLMSLCSPYQNPVLLVGCALALAICSATQDIAIDAYRIERLAPLEPAFISAGSAAATAGWWTGYAGIGGIPLWLSDMNFGWPVLYQLMAGFMGALALACLWLEDPPEPHGQAANQAWLARRFQVPAERQLPLLGLMVLPWVIIAWGLLGSPGLPNLGLGEVPFLSLLVLLAAAALVWQLLRLPLQATGATAISSAAAAVSSPVERLANQLRHSMLTPLESFFKERGVKFALALLVFMLAFRLGEAMLGRMSIVFYKEVGFSNSDIATYSKMITWWATVLFALPCGLLNAKLGLVRGLMISGCAMAGSNLMFSWIAWAGPDTRLLAAAVLVDGFTAAWATVAFISFASALCQQGFSATQYALFASISNLGRTTLASNSGVLVDFLDGNWAVFFVITTLLVLPALSILWFLRRKIAQINTG
jgi:MFS transporter, PAT family, beta-lactamase induction signal transducer AmpG